MKVTVFQSAKTSGKIPYSPTRDKKFMFETYNVNNISDVFFQLTSNFMLNMPLIKSTKTPHYRRRENLESYFADTLEWITVDLDEIQKLSDRSLCIEWLRKQNYEIILAESRNPLNIKGIIKVDNLTPKETKLALSKWKEYLPAKVDLSVTHYASYQAPILKSKILYENKGKPLVKVKEEILPTLPALVITEVPTNIQEICKKNFQEKGFVFHEDGKCSHFTEKKTPKGFSWLSTAPFKMMHWNPDRVVDIWKEVIQTKEYKKFSKEVAKKEIINIMPKTKEGINKRFLGKETETVNTFFDRYKVLKIQSPMGTAKSTVIDEVITQSKERDLRVLLITNRISLADDITEKYNNIKHYQHTEVDGVDKKYHIGDNLVCQVNSLWRFSLKYFDVVIIDEATSLLFQLLSLEKNTKNIVTKVFATKHKKVVLADAFLFEPLVNLFSEKQEVLSIDNNYRDDANLIMYSQVDRWALEILNKTKEGVVTISSGSTKILKSLELIFTKQGISYFTMSSETPRAEKELVYKEFQKKDPRWGVIMYSPTITVGISILASSDNHFHLDRGTSMDVVSSIQMIKRNRAAKNIHLLLAEKQQYKPISLDRIESELLEFSDEDDQGDILGISEVGLKFAKVHKIYNTLENRHQVSFLNLLKYQFKMKNVSKDVTRVTPFMGKIGKLVKKIQTQQDLDLFDEYRKMSPEELSEIEYSLFKTSKREEKINLFNVLMEDETIHLSKPDMEELVKEEIRNPGIIDMFKNNIKTPKIDGQKIIQSKNGFSYSVNDFMKFKSKGINLLGYGYRREKNIYRLNQVLAGLVLENT